MFKKNVSQTNRPRIYKKAYKHHIYTTKIEQFWGKFLLSKTFGLNKISKNHLKDDLIKFH